MLDHIAALPLMMVALIAITSCAPTDDKRSPELMYSQYGPGAHCEVNGQLIPHGQVFTDPTLSRCLQHQCYYGSSFIVSEGCEDGQTGCHGVGESWEENCVTFTCTKTTVGGYNYFQPIVRTARCRDIYGGCHRPGELFSYRLHGRVHDNCRCNITDNRIYYRCY